MVMVDDSWSRFVAGLAVDERVSEPPGTVARGGRPDAVFPLDAADDARTCICARAATRMLTLDVPTSRATTLALAARWRMLSSISSAALPALVTFALNGDDNDDGGAVDTAALVDDGVVPGLDDGCLLE